MAVAAMHLPERHRRDANATRKSCRSSLYNSYVPPMGLGGTVFTLVNGNETIPLDDEHCDIAVLAHFPICNFRFAVKDNGPVVWVRGFTTMLPGDHEASNTPGVVFE